jgi:hypothetical protein
MVSKGVSFLARVYILIQLIFPSLHQTSSLQDTLDLGSITKMLYSTIILTLATAASAVDIRFFSEAHCKNAIGTSCVGAGVNQCCSGRQTKGWNAVSFAAIPPNWDLLTRSYTGKN